MGRHNRRLVMALVAALITALVACRPKYPDRVGAAGNFAFPVGPCGGDTSGAEPNCTVARIQGHAFASTAPAVGDVATWSGSAWATEADVLRIPGLKLYYRADSGVTLSGSNVTAWVDQTSSALSATGTSGHYPTYNATDAAYNNVPTVSFASATGQLLLSSTISALAQPITICVVGQAAELVNGQYVVSFGDNSFVNQVALTTTIVPTKLFIIGQSFTSASSTNASVQSPGVFCGVLNGANSAVYTTNSQTADGTGNAGANTITTRIGIGGRVDGNNTLDGKIEELAVFSGSLSAPQRSVFTAYATRRCALSAATFQ